jgi:hypothetical protein
MGTINVSLGPNLIEGGCWAKTEFPILRRSTRMTGKQVCFLEIKPI